ncbi:MAG: hemerythrin domain-containing protein [Myxococcaceae bacterium]
MDPIEILEAQHREAEALFKLIAAETNALERHALFVRLARALKLHTQLEEEIIYPELRTAVTEAEIHHSFDEHARVSAHLLQMARLHPNSTEFEGHLIEIRQAVEAHVSEERSVLFPFARRVLSEEQASSLYEQLIDRMQELLEPDGLPVFEARFGSQ